ncbi:hypothetical protein CV093_17925 [Oceanobacillus sp. 143]|nr:hypothetical protein CV093_17925 [Oceanobacillus sp. 143]
MVLLIFLPFALYFIVEENGEEFVYKILLAIGTMYSLRNIYYYLSTYISGKAELLRITLLDSNTTVPFPLFIASLLTCKFIFKKINTFEKILLIINIAGFAVTQTRSMILSYGLIVFCAFLYNLIKKIKLLKI